MAVWPTHGSEPWDDALKAYIDEGDAGGGGGAVDSVNGQTGDVTLDAADVGAAPTVHTHIIGDVTGLQTALDAKQPLDPDLTAIAALASAADKLPYATGPQAWALTDLSPFARTFLDDADAATVRATLGITAGASFVETTSATAIGTAAKVATIGSGFAYTDGALLTVVLTSGNTAAAPTLNIDGLGAKSIFYGGSAATALMASTAANGRWFLRYDAATDRFDMLGMSWNYDMASQAVVEAGTSALAGFISPQRIKQAVQYQTGIRGPNVQTAGYTFVADDAERMVEYNNSGGANFTIPPGVFIVGTTLKLYAIGTGMATFVQGSTVTFQPASSYVTRAQGSVIFAYQRAANNWVIYGDLQ